MAFSQQTNFGSLAVGGAPRVAGVIATREGLASLAEFPCDLVEVRLDLTGRPTGWLDQCERIEALGKPVLLTIRLTREGGKWTGADEKRLPLFAKAIPRLAAVDVELDSRIAREVGESARERGKACVVSFHDFEKTPPNAELEDAIGRAEEIGGVTKIAAMVKSDDDAERLVALLGKNRRNPLCVIGMGDAAANLRVDLPKKHGSCLAYGYLDKPTAPGQWPVQDFLTALRS